MINMKNKKESHLLAITGLVLLLLCVPLFCVNSTSAATYSVTINTKYNGVSNGNSVPIMEDGTSTSFSTPHTFSGLSGTHTFSVPYEDSSGHPFYEWDNKVPTDCVFPTITASSSGSYWAFYDSQVPRNSGGTVGAVSPAEQRYYVTPSDPAVVAAAADKSWSDILNWVASHLTYNFSETTWQFPNETLSLGSGQCRDYSTLCVSMLLSRGYSAYVVTGNVTAASGVNTNSANGHAWVVIKLGGALYHFEPQRTWANQPSPQNFSLGYFADYFNDNNELYPASASLDPPSAQTYDVTIDTRFITISADANVEISEDGVPTGFVTPHTFAGLNGIHNFSVPYAEVSGFSFMSWSTNAPGEQIYPTITVSSGGAFTAFYDSQFSLSHLYPAENRYLITPLDATVVSAAANKNFTDIVDFVSTLPYAVCQTAQFPNQTLSHGTCFLLDIATTCVSMLRSAGYDAYLVEGNTSTSTNTHWVVFSHNGVSYHVDPQQSWKNQQTVDFGSYQANFYIDENGIYPAGMSQDPPSTLPNPSSTIYPNATPTPTPQVPEFSAGLAFAALASALAILVALKKRAPRKRLVSN
jgi:transglutaminase-like putative cysteine protease